MEQVGKRCEAAAGVPGKKKLKENHILGEFENIVHVVRPRKDVGVGSGRT